MAVCGRLEMIESRVGEELVVRAVLDNAAFVKDGYAACEPGKVATYESDKTCPTGRPHPCRGRASA